LAAFISEMQEPDDHALLREYAERHSEAAFAELVARHVDKVYSTALRHTRNPHQAGEITQAVFIILAQKAGKISGQGWLRRPRRNADRRRGVAATPLSGWLYQTARLTAVTRLRGEIRRARREQEALMQIFQNENEPDHWRHIAPLLDDALARLGEKDRHAVVLRFFDGKSFGEVGAALGGSEDAAKMRVSRALEKLRKFFAKRGVTLTAAAIAGAVSANSVHAAPAGLAKVISAVAITKGATAGGSTLALAKGALKIMAWSKMKTTIFVSASVLLAVGATAVMMVDTPRSEHQQSVVERAPVLEPIILAWQQGNQAEAVGKFIEADWNTRPLFARNSVLSLSEKQFKALSDAERKAKSEEMLPRLAILKQLAAAVLQTGRDAAAKGDKGRARRSFVAIEQCGADLAKGDYMLIVQLVGKAFEKMADSEIAKLT
jgi:RNA polymerase sigma factor (sigma-70 family)